MFELGLGLVLDGVWLPEEGLGEDFGVVILGVLEGCCTTCPGE